MKNHKNKEKSESKSIVESYEIIGDKMILDIRKGNKVEHKFLKRIRLPYEDPRINEIAKEESKNIKAIGEKNFIIITCGYCIINFGILAIKYSSLLSTILVCSSVGVIALSVMFKKKNIKNLNELEKEKIYIKMKDDLKKEIRKHQGLSKSLIKEETNETLIEEMKTTTEFNLASIDELSLDDLRNIKEAIECEKSLGLEASNNESFQYIKK